MIIEYILRGELNSFPLTEDITNDQLRECEEIPTGNNWTDNFIKRTPEFKTRWRRSYDRQRALTEDPRAISPYSTLVMSFGDKYDSQDEDVCNFG